jgi:hypothetical protein
MALEDHLAWSFARLFADPVRRRPSVCGGSEPDLSGPVF